MATLAQITESLELFKQAVTGPVGATPKPVTPPSSPGEAKGGGPEMLPAPRPMPAPSVPETLPMPRQVSPQSAAPLPATGAGAFAGAGAVAGSQATPQPPTWFARNKGWVYPAAMIGGGALLARSLFSRRRRDQ